MRRLGVRRRWAERRLDGGSASVEFALILPLLLTIALALVQVGVLAKDRLVVEEAARAAAREAAVSVDDATVRAAAAAAAGDLDRDRLVVLVTREGGIGTAVEVAVVYDAPVSIPLVGWLFPPTVRIAGHATMRQEMG